jgi:predicted RNase H-like HicB family nuclease
MQYQVLIENGNQNGFVASVIGMPDCRAEGRTEEEAIAGVKAALANLLSQSKVVTIEIETGRLAESHLPKHAARFKDRLTDNELLAEMAKYRREINAEDLKRLDGQKIPLGENPWLATAGIFKDDPSFDQFLENIAAYRREVDEREAAKDAVVEGAARVASEAVE